MRFMEFIKGKDQVISDPLINTNKIKYLIQYNSKELTSAIALASTLFFFAPISVFIVNAKFLEITLGGIWHLFLFTTVIAFIPLTVIALIAKPIFPFIAVIYIALSICFVIQGNFLTYNLDPLDGRDILWDSYKSQSWLELLLWAALIGFTFLFKRFIYKHILSIFVLLVVYQVSSNLISIYTNPLPNHGSGLYFETAKEFEFSKSHNVILIVLDTFSSEAFDQILTKYPAYRDDFKDFTFYKDAVGGYPTTLPSIPLLLTGEYFDNSIPITQFIDGNEAKAIPILLKKNGFTIEQYPFVPYFHSAYDNNTYDIPIAYRKSMAMEQYVVSGMRYMPLVLKQYFYTEYYDGRHYYHKDMVDFINRVNETKITNPQPIFKFFHFSGAHPPYQLDESFNRTDKGYIEQAAASINLVKELLDQLKSAGAYANSLIIVVGDHGLAQQLENYRTPPVSSVLTLMLVKRVEQYFGEMQTSNSPVAISDIPKSIADELKIPNSYPGFSIFDPIPISRTRRWFYYQWKHLNWIDDYLPNMVEFEILGPAHQQKSYKLLYFSDSTDNGYPDADYQYGSNAIDTMISKDDFRQFWSYNFSYEKAEDLAWSWASAPLACFYLNVQPVTKELRVLIEAHPFLVDGKLDDQTMNVFIDKREIASFHKDSKLETKISANLAKQLTSDHQIELCFEFPDAKLPPKDYGLGSDPRILGYAFSSIILK